jgi:DNA-binding beta-propeller fold protein YncE
VLGKFAAGDGAAGVASDGASVWVASNGTNTVIKLSTAGTVLGTYKVGRSPYGVALVGGTAWVANSGSNTVSKQ